MMLKVELTSLHEGHELLCLNQLLMHLLWKPCWQFFSKHIPSESNFPLSSLISASISPSVISPTPALRLLLSFHWSGVWLMYILGKLLMVFALFNTSLFSSLLLQSDLDFICIELICSHSLPLKYSRQIAHLSHSSIFLPWLIHFG